MIVQRRFYLVLVILAALFEIIPARVCLAARQDSVASSAPLDLHYDGVTVSGYFEDIAVVKVLDALAKELSLRVSFADKVTKDRPITGSLQSDQPQTAIAEILDGFSYALCATSNGLELIVLSTEPKRPHLGITASKTKQNAPPEQHDSVPQTLNNFMPLTFEEPQLQGDEELSEEIDPVVDEVPEQEYYEALLQRGIQALRSEHQHLHAEAIEQLADIKDPRATEALRDAVINIDIDDAELRVQVAAALVRHAEQMKSIDPSATYLIKQLSFDAESNVRRIAQEAIKQMQRYGEKSV